MPDGDETIGTSVLTIVDFFELIKTEDSSAELPRETLSAIEGATIDGRDGMTEELVIEGVPGLVTEDALGVVTGALEGVRGCEIAIELPGRGFGEPPSPGHVE